MALNRQLEEGRKKFTTFSEEFEFFATLCKQFKSILIYMDVIILLYGLNPIFGSLIFLSSAESALFKVVGI